MQAVFFGVTMKHPDLTQYFADQRDDSDAQLECYFDDYTMSLWHVYVNESEIYNLLADSVIASLEREYARHVRNQARESALDYTIDRYESKQLDKQMGIWND